MSDGPKADEVEARLQRALFALRRIEAVIRCLAYTNPDQWRSKADLRLTFLDEHCFLKAELEADGAIYPSQEKQ